MKKHFCGQSFWTGKAKWNGETTNGASVTQCWTGVGTLISSSCHRQRTHQVEKWRKFESFPEMHRACHGNCKSGKLSPTTKSSHELCLSLTGDRGTSPLIIVTEMGQLVCLGAAAKAQNLFLKSFEAFTSEKTIHHLIDPKWSAKLQILIHGGIQGTRWCV